MPKNCGWLRYGVEVLASNLHECILHGLYRTGAMSSNFVLLTTTYHRNTLPSLPGERDSEERGYINASHHGGSSCRSYWQ